MISYVHPLDEYDYDEVIKKAGEGFPLRLDSLYAVLAYQRFLDLIRAALPRRLRK